MNTTALAAMRQRVKAHRESLVVRTLGPELRAMERELKAAAKRCEERLELFGKMLRKGC